MAELPRPGRPERARLYPAQAEAVERLARHLRRAGTRALFVSATGTGKTLVSIRTADELGARLVLFVHRGAHPHRRRPAPPPEPDRPRHHPSRRR